MARSGEVTVRRLRPGDGTQLAALLREAFVEEFEGSGTEDWAVRRQARSAGWAQTPGFRQMLGALGARFAYFVAVHQGRVVGSTAVAGARLPVISSVAVLPEYRRAGVAQALLTAAHAFVRDQGRDRVSLDVLAHNAPALRLYEKLGYVEYHRYRAYEYPSLSLIAAATAPPGYWLEPLSPKRGAGFSAIERAALPPRYFEVAPTLRDRYLQSRTVQWLERLAAGLRGYRRVLVQDGRTTGYLLVTVAPGHSEARIEYPIVLPEATAALPAALIDAVNFAQSAGRHAVRLDLSEERPDQHEAAEALGFRHRWTFVQMARWLSTPLRIPIRVAPRR